MTPTAPNTIPAEDTRHSTVVVAPTYHNAATLGQLLDAVSALGFPVIAVNDGSTDDTPAVLAAWQALDPARRHVITHAHNLGKAQAMRSGFDLASRLGFSHAATIDTDGQHDPADLPRLLHALPAHGRALVVGARPTSGPGYPLKSRLGRALSNALVRLLGGVVVSDSQCGLRLYPVDIVRKLGARTSRYAFETEVLTRCGWAHVDVREIEVRCIYRVPSGRVSHFRPVGDSLHAAWMHTRLLCRSLAPWPYIRLGYPHAHPPGGTIVERLARWLNPVHAYRALRRDPAERQRLAPSLAWGVIVGFQPPVGQKTALCLLLAKAFRLQPLVVITTSSLLTPPIGLLAWGLSIGTGHYLLHGTWPSRAAYDLHGPARDLLARLALEWTLGATACGLTLATIVYLATRLTVARLDRATQQNTAAVTSAERA